MLKQTNKLLNNIESGELSLQKKIGKSGLNHRLLKNSGFFFIFTEDPMRK